MYSIFYEIGLTDWLSGSGETSDTPQLLLHILAKRACAERQSRCPTGAGVGRHANSGYTTCQ
jgi:hypothetical protein